MLSFCLSCLSRRRGCTSVTDHRIDEKPSSTYQAHEAMRYHDETPETKAQDAANSIVHIIANSENIDASVQLTLEDIVRQAGGWRESIATKVLTALENVLRSDTIPSALAGVREKALVAAASMKQFAGEHPILTGLFCTIVALGVLYLVWPAVLEALGFSSLGPVEGKDF